MRDAAYGILKSLPVKLTALAGWTFALLATLYTSEIRSLLGDKHLPENLLHVSVPILVVTTIYTTALWLLKPSVIAAPEPQPLLSTHSTVADVESQGEGTPRPQVMWTDESLDGLRRAITGDGARKANLPLKGALVRVYKSLGGAPEHQQDKAAFYKRVDLSLGDKVHLEGVHVWGRFMDRPLEPLLRTDQLVFNHRRGVVLVRGDTVYPMEFTDVMFNKEEVEQAWLV